MAKGDGALLALAAVGVVAFMYVKGKDKLGRWRLCAVAAGGCFDYPATSAAEATLQFQAEFGFSPESVTYIGPWV